MVKKPEPFQSLFGFGLRGFPWDVLNLDRHSRRPCSQKPCRKGEKAYNRRIVPSPDSGVVEGANPGLCKFVSDNTVVNLTDIITCVFFAGIQAVHFRRIRTCVNFLTKNEMV
jgi:hypothetical protein